MANRGDEFDVAVVGGGLAGLAAAAYLARAGRRVAVYERASAPGGRAATRRDGEFRFNQGPHALYRGGRGVEVLRELGVAIDGGLAPVSGGFARWRGELHTLPAG